MASYQFLLDKELGGAPKIWTAISGVAEVFIVMSLAIQEVQMFWLKML